MSPESNGSASLPEGESGVGNPFKNVNVGIDKVESSSTEGGLEVIQPTANTESSSVHEPAIDQTIPHDVDTVDSQEAYKGQKLVLAAREAATSILEKAAKGYLGLLENPIEGSKIGFLLVGSTLTTIYTAASVEAAKILTPDGGTFWNGLTELAKLPTWILQGGWDRASERVIMQAWSAPVLAATFAVVTGVSIAAIHRSRKEKDSAVIQDNLNIGA